MCWRSTSSGRPAKFALAENAWQAARSAKSDSKSAPAWQIEDLAMYWSDDEQPTLCVRGAVVGGVGEAATSAQLIVSACNRELLCETVAAGSRFQFTRTIDGWPQEHDEPAPTPVEARLMVEGQTSWRAILPTAPPRADAHDPPADFSGATSAAPLWLDYLELESPELTEVLQQSAGRVIGSRGAAGPGVHAVRLRPDWRGAAVADLLGRARRASVGAPSFDHRLGSDGGGVGGDFG